MSHPHAETERFLDRLYEAELHLDSLAQAEEFLEAQAALSQQQALASLAQLPAVEREHLIRLLGAPEGKQALPESRAERLFLDAEALSAFRQEICASLDGELRELASQARDAIRNAARHTGRERGDDLKDARSLLETAVRNPLAARNPALWFELGWTLWKIGGDAPAAENAFYQAVRLSGDSSEKYSHHALRHLAHVQAAQGKGEEAFQSVQRIVGEGLEDPQVWLEAVRYATLADRLADAAKLAGKALERDPSSISALFAEPDLVALGAARVQALERVTEDVRAAYKSELRRWRDAIERIADLEILLGRTIPLAPEMTASSDGGALGDEPPSLYAGQRLVRLTAERADAVLLEGRARLMETLEYAHETEEQFRRRVEIIHSEKQRWTSEKRIVEEQARSAGIPLHAYSWENPLQRQKNARAKHLREVFASCETNLAVSEQAFAEQLPAIERERAAAAARVGELEEALRGLDASLPSML